MQKKMTLKTRPFQPFLLGVDDLLRLARPYYDQIQANRKRYEESDKIEILPQGVWQTEKSLSIGSFLLKYAGLEALLNCLYNDFKVNSLDVIPNEYFGEKLAQVLSKLAKKNFVYWYLPSRVFLVIPLCTEPPVDPRGVFDTESNEWRKFEEIVQIRHSFSHAVSGDREFIATRKGPKLWVADDSDPSNFWPVTQAPRDHRILNYEVAVSLCGVIDWVIERIRKALPEKLTDSYLGQEQGKVAED